MLYYYCKKISCDNFCDITKEETMKKALSLILVLVVVVSTLLVCGCGKKPVNSGSNSQTNTQTNNTNTNTNNPVEKEENLPNDADDDISLDNEIKF